MQVMIQPHLPTVGWFLTLISACSAMHYWATHPIDRRDAPLGLDELQRIENVNQISFLKGYGLSIHPQSFSEKFEGQSDI